MSLLSFLNENISLQKERSIDDIRNLSNNIKKNDSKMKQSAENLPISIEDDGEWSVLPHPERIQRNFNFDHIKEVIYFSNELLKYQEEINHHAKIEIQNKSVRVSSYTHDIQAVTFLDDKIKKFCNDIYDDLNHLKKVRNERE
jgi:pterin-4a-carbinolamine dehydratase